MERTKAGPVSTRPSRRLRGNGGFTLIEALVAFVILALVMVVLQRGVVGSVDAATRAKERLEASLVVRTLLSSPTITQAGQPMSGRMSGHDWTVRFEEVPLAAGTAGKTGSNIFRPMRMIVEVRTHALRGGLLAVEQVQSVRSSGEAAP